MANFIEFILPLGTNATESDGLVVVSDLIHEVLGFEHPIVCVIVLD